MKYKRNILLDHWHTFFRSFNVTQGIWLIYLFSRGFSIFEIAIFEGIFHITSLLMEIPTGAIADVLGRKYSRVLGILSYFIYIAIILNSSEFYVVAISFVFCGLSYVFESGAAEAIVYDTHLKLEEEDKFMKFLGVKEAIFQISGYLALMVSGAIATISFDLSFYVTGVFFLFALFMILSMKEVPVERTVKPTFKEQLKNQFVVSTKTVMKNKRLFLLIIIGALMTAPVTTLFFFLQNYFDHQGVPLTLITIYIGFHSGGSAIGGLLAHKLENKLGEKKLLYIVPFITMMSFWIVMYQYLTVPAFIVLGILDSIFYVVLIDYINRMVKSEERATVLSFFGMAFSIVMIIIFTPLGYVIDVYGFELMFIILAIIVSVFYIALLVVIKGNHLEEDKMV